MWLIMDNNRIPVMNFHGLGQFSLNRGFLIHQFVVDRGWWSAISMEGWIQNLILVKQKPNSQITWKSNYVLKVYLAKTFCHGCVCVDNFYTNIILDWNDFPVHPLGLREIGFGFGMHLFITREWGLFFVMHIAKLGQGVLSIVDRSILNQLIGTIFRYLYTKCNWIGIILKQLTGHHWLSARMQKLHY